MHDTGRRNPDELQKVKAQIAFHQVYGVRFEFHGRATARSVSIAGYYGLRAAGPMVRIAPSSWKLIDRCRRATYSRAAVNDKSWFTSAPADAPVSGLAEAIAEEKDDPNVVGRIHHFLLPAAGLGAAADPRK